MFPSNTPEITAPSRTREFVHWCLLFMLMLTLAFLIGCKGGGSFDMTLTSPIIGTEVHAHADAAAGPQDAHSVPAADPQP